MIMPSSRFTSLLLGLSLMIVINTQESEGYRILGIFPFNARSHMVMFEALMKGLARRGHQVDVVSTFPQKKPYPNYTDIVIPSALDALVNNMSYSFIEDMRENSVVQIVAESMGSILCEKGLKFSQIQNLIKNPPNNPPYDLVITEVFGAHCFMAFGPHLKVPVIAMSSASLYPWINDIIGNPENLAFVPNNLLEFMERMNFWQRLSNVAHTFYHKWRFNYYSSFQDKAIKENFGINSPGVRELERDVALILVNTHYSMNDIKPTTPALIEVGGLHVQDDDTEIPPEHKKWLDESTNGFVYFTFGSMAKIESFPKPILDILYKSLKKIAPVRVFMKVPNPEMLPAGLPNNIRTFSWMPQLKVLKHKNIRVFLSHGGLMGTQEAIACAVPILGIPLFGDQFFNIDRCMKKKIAVRLSFSNITEEKLDIALKEILHNPIYKEAMKRVSEQFLDRPLSAMDTACYWVEYVIRHGNKALRSPALDFSWWQIALLDVYAFLTLTIILIIITGIILLTFFINIFRQSSTISSSKKIN